MARIYDNIEIKFTEGLKNIITGLGVKRVDFCVGYFNLRGWNLVVDQIDQLQGEMFMRTTKRFSEPVVCLLECIAHPKN